MVSGRVRGLKRYRVEGLLSMLTDRVTGSRTTLIIVGSTTKASGQHNPSLLSVRRATGYTVPEGGLPTVRVRVRV